MIDERARREQTLDIGIYLRIESGERKESTYYMIERDSTT